MINWATDEYCRRCHQLLTAPSAQTESGFTAKTFQIYLGVFIAATALPILVARADQAMGDHLAMFLVVLAYGLAFSCKFLLIFQMFRVSVLWGLTGIFLAPLSTLLFTVNYWERAKKPIVLCLAAILYCIVMIAGVGNLTKPKVAQNTTAAPPPAPLTRYLDETPTPKPDFLQPRKDLLKKKPSDK